MTGAAAPVGQAGTTVHADETVAWDDGRLSELGRPGARFARAERERRGAPARSGRALDQNRSPALADIIGAPRVRTAVMISSGSIRCR
jgi:hypothetical protein